MIKKTKKFLGEQVHYAILWVIWFIGFCFSLVPIFFFINLSKEELDQKTFGESVIIALVVVGTMVVGGLLFLLYTWLKKRWGH